MCVCDNNFLLSNVSKHKTIHGQSTSQNNSTLWIYYSRRWNSQLHSTASRAQLTHSLDRAVHFFSHTNNSQYETLGLVHFTSAYFGNLCAHSNHKSIIKTNTILRFIFDEISFWSGYASYLIYLLLFELKFTQLMNHSNSFQMVFVCLTFFLSFAIRLIFFWLLLLNKLYLNSWLFYGSDTLMFIEKKLWSISYQWHNGNRWVTGRLRVCDESLI